MLMNETPEAADAARPTLTYFDVRGRAEVIRLILEEVGQPYRERRIALSEWGALKPSFPFGQVPLYQEGELSIPHSHAIYRYLARKHGLCGGSEAERIRLDIVEETFVDLQNELGVFYWSPQFHDNRDEYERSKLPALLDKAQRLLVQNRSGDGYWVGTDLTFVDFCAWHFLDYVRPFSQRTLDTFEKLVAFKRRIESRPRVAAYLASERRPKTQTVPMAPFGGTPETS
jgi:glutathione S-transferase